MTIKNRARKILARFLIYIDFFCGVYIVLCGVCIALCGLYCILWNLYWFFAKKAILFSCKNGRFVWFQCQKFDIYIKNPNWKMQKNAKKCPFFIVFLICYRKWGFFCFDGAIWGGFCGWSFCDLRQASILFQRKSAFEIRHWLWGKYFIR